jgi:hypothetical protein
VQIPDEVHELITKLDASMIEMTDEINALEQQQTTQIAAIDTKLNETKNSLEQAEKQLFVLEKDQSAVDCLVEGTANIVDVFKVHHIALDTKCTTEFIERHFDLEQLLLKKLTLTDQLVFSPPAIYSVPKELHEEERHLQGLDARELRAKESLDDAIKTIQQDAGEIKERGREELRLEQQTDLATPANLTSELTPSNNKEIPITRVLNPLSFFKPRESSTNKKHGRLDEKEKNNNNLENKAVFFKQPHSTTNTSIKDEPANNENDKTIKNQ